MSNQVLLSATFVKRFRRLPKAEQRRIRAAMDALADDPLTPRSGAAIKPLADTDPPKHRLRVGDWRIVYVVEGATVRVVEVFARVGVIGSSRGTQCHRPHETRMPGNTHDRQTQA